jgi:signal transduction histidine kinase
MRFTVSKKISVAFAVILLAGTLSMLIIYRGLSVLHKAMHELADIKEPISAAAYEMEINVNGIGLGVMKYLESADPTYRALVEDDERDFERFHTRYLQLAQTQEEKALGQRIGFLYSEFKRLGHQLIGIRDNQESLFEIVGEHFERLDEIIDDTIQVQLDPQDRDSLEKLAKVNDLESDIAEVGFWLLRYQRSQKPQDKQLLLQNETEFRDTLTRFNTLRLSAEERRWTSMLEGGFNHMIALAHQTLELEKQLRMSTRQFVRIRLEIDALVDEKMQTLALTALVTPRREADQEIASVVRMTLFLIPIFVLSVIGVALLLIRTIIKPVQTLIRGTQAVSRRDLTYRVGPLGRDEFGELAAYFDLMVAELQATTVSKGLLQESETKLRETVDDLRREIITRERTEAEGARLQVSLQRSELMAAMGSLIVGVAHEVRNPLFAISSTLDAFEARFAAQPEYQRYIGVFRTEVDRLTTLMQELLEYGKPPTLDLVPDSPEKAVAQALHVCTPLATRMHVHMVSPSRRETGLVRMHQQRLVQVFQNLLENAIQHSPPGGGVVVETEGDPLDGQDWIAYRIKDAGPGFRPEDLPRVFDPFFTRRRGGTGLGMSIAQRIVEEHGGNITAGNCPEGGAVIVVRFPLIQQSIRDGRDQEEPHGTEHDLSG